MKRTHVKETTITELFSDLNFDERGFPPDKNNLECGLPDFLKESIATMMAAWKMLDSGEEYLHWDCNYCSLQSDINSAEVNLHISEEQAWFLREKYLRMRKETEPIE